VLEDVTGYFDLLVDDHPLGRAIRFRAHPHLSGRDGGRTFDLRQLALEGMKLHGHLLDVEGTAVRFADDLADNLDAIDAKCAEDLAAIDRYIAEHGLDAPAEDAATADWRPGPAPATFDLVEAGIGTVIYATGYHYDFRWIDLPVFDERGYPRYDRGITEIPGLYFVGLHWMHTQGSGLFYQVGRDAGYVVDHLRRAGA